MVGLIVVIAVLTSLATLTAVILRVKRRRLSARPTQCSRGGGGGKSDPSSSSAERRDSGKNPDIVPLRSELMIDPLGDAYQQPLAAYSAAIDYLPPSTGILKPPKTRTKSLQDISIFHPSSPHVRFEENGGVVVGFTMPRQRDPYWPEHIEEASPSSLSTLLNVSPGSGVAIIPTSQSQNKMESAV
ncbi:unnamed protein product [Cyprideis torosa]|uniref:Uncharacterized protein n=1 Tax=Cyprideis torosa TaxID=163714 RepID=A0A7R8ZK18_9CRUS|nr:unnamed protein product [Cyprideis torosa]CAG0883518.1 unnamed protein product [Cyprideis torosa]